MEPNDVSAGTSPAAETPELSFETLTPEAHKKFMETGELDLETATTPGTEPKSDAVSPGQADDKSGAAPEAAKKESQQESARPPNREERRNQKLNNENRDLRARLEALEKAAPTKAETRQATSEGDPRPDPDNFKTIKEWQVADTEWIDRRMEARLTKEREVRAEEARQAESEKSVESTTKTFADDIKEYRKTLTEDTFAEDFTEVKDYLRKNKLGYLEDAIVESRKPQLFTYFADHFDELEKLAKMTPTAALREFGRLEVSDKLKAPAPRKHTQSRKLTPQVDGNAAADDDDTRLLDPNIDQATFNKIMDRREKRELAESRR